MTSEYKCDLGMDGLGKAIIRMKTVMWGSHTKR